MQTSKKNQSQYRAKVSIARLNDSIYDTVRRAIDHLGGMGDIVKKGDRVLLKPNLAYPYPPPATTDPRVVEAVARLCLEAGAAEVFIGDSTSYSCKNIMGFGRWSNQDVIEQTGMAEAANRAGARIADFDKTGWRRVSIPAGIVLKKVEISELVLDADVLINIPAMKTHFETLVTLGIKNYHGIIPDHYKIQYHRDEISQKLVDLHKAVKTQLTVLDGLVAMEGLGPRLGGSVQMDLILASTDVVAVDAIASEVMGIRSDEVETTRLADTQGIGCGKVDEIQVLGEEIEKVRRPFARPDVRISGLFPGVTILQGGPCQHCYGRARIFLETLQSTGLENNGGVTALLVGVKPPLPDLDELEGKVVFVGDCALEGAMNLRYALGKRAICLEGCPPIPSLHREIERLKQEGEKS